MNRLPLAAGLVLAGAAVALGASYQERLEQIRATAEAERKKLGLQDDRARLYAQYPTPEVAFGGDPLETACGQAKDVRIAGKFAKGTAFVIAHDDVRALGEKLDAEGWKARLAPHKDAAPGPVRVHAIVPVSGAERSTEVMVVRGRYQIDARFDDGWAASMVTDGNSGGEFTWSKGSEKRAGIASVHSNGSRVSVDVAPPAERQKLEMEEMQKLMAAVEASGMTALQEKIQGCGKLPQDRLIACLQALQGETEKLRAQADEADKRMKAQILERQPKAAWNCTGWRLHAREGKLTGTASCAGEVEQKVTGTLRCLAPE